MIYFKHLCGAFQQLLGEEPTGMMKNCNQHKQRETTAHCHQCVAAPGVSQGCLCSLSLCHLGAWEHPCCHVPIPWKVSPWQPPKQRCPHGDLCAVRTYLPTACAHVLPDTAAASASSFLSHRLTPMPLQQAEGTACSPGHLQSPYIVFLS